MHWVEGSYIGKGIIDIDAFEKALGDRFPENRILSHDLLEGCHARSGLISDVMLFEDYPSSYLTDIKRRHRWIRGDWQIARWLLPKVPGPGHRVEKNPLSALSRWKIADNLRRSLMPIGLFMLFLFGWFVSDTPWFWTIIGLLTILPAPLLAFVHMAFDKPKDIDYSLHAINALESLISHLLQQIWTIVVLPFETYINIDAICRTWWRILISHKNLLQWDPFTTVNPHKTLIAHFQKMWFAPVSGVVILIALIFYSLSSFILASPLVFAWMASPFFAWMLSIRQARKGAHLSESNSIFLRKISRKTWAYFEHFVGPEDNYLPPDNYQEYPSSRTAHRTSPTNLGVSLLSILGAHDFGYVTTSKVTELSKLTFDSMLKLDRFKGHFYNWYDTLSLVPLFPRYISTVDSGNLAASLLTLKEGLIELKTAPLVSNKMVEGILDTLRILIDKKGVSEIFKKLVNEVEAISLDSSLRVSDYKNIFEKISQSAKTYTLSEFSQQQPDTQWWAETLHAQCEDILSEIEQFASFLVVEDQAKYFNDLLPDFPFIPTLQELANLTPEFLTALDLKTENIQASNGHEWIENFNHTFRQIHEIAKVRIAQLDQLIQYCLDLSSYEYDFLYDKTQRYLAIGYNVEEHRRDPGFYDLLGSEARLGIYVAISQGKIPQESWFSLGRQVTNAAKILY
jgi:hypothetical protein